MIQIFNVPELANFSSYILCMYIPLLFQFRVLMVDIFIMFRVKHFFPVQITVISGQWFYFYYISVHQVQIKKLTLNRNKKKGGSRGAQRVEIGVIG